MGGVGGLGPRGVVGRQGLGGVGVAPGQVGGPGQDGGQFLLLIGGTGAGFSQDDVGFLPPAGLGQGFTEQEAGAGGVPGFGEGFQERDGLGIVVGIAGHGGGLEEYGRVRGAGGGQPPGCDVQRIARAPGSVGLQPLGLAEEDSPAAHSCQAGLNGFAVQGVGEGHAGAAPVLADEDQPGVFQVIQHLLGGGSLSSGQGQRAAQR